MFVRQFVGDTFSLLPVCLKYSIRSLRLQVHLWTTKFPLKGNLWYNKRVLGIKTTVNREGITLTLDPNRKTTPNIARRINHLLDDYSNIETYRTKNEIILKAQLVNSQWLTLNTVNR